MSKQVSLVQIRLAVLLTLLNRDLIFVYQVIIIGGEYRKGAIPQANAHSQPRGQKLFRARYAVYLYRCVQITARRDPDN